MQRKRRGHTARCRLLLCPHVDASPAPAAGPERLVASRAHDVAEGPDHLVARRKATFRVGGPDELPAPAHVRLRPARRYHVRLRAPAGAEVADGPRLRVRHLAATAEVARDAVVFSQGIGRLDTRTDTVAVGLEVVVPRGGRVPAELVVEFVDVGDRPALRSFVLVPGAMKSGTSTLHGYLRQHPGICPSRRKEPEFFSSDAHALGEAAYRDLFRYDERTHVVGLDASTGYTKYPGFPDVAARLAAFPADFRFVYVLRDPVDRIESHLAHNVARGRASPERAMDDAARLEAALDVSSYAFQLDRYAAAFPDLADRLLLVDFDELVADPVTVLRRVESLLDLPAHDYVDVGAKNTRRSEHGSDRVRLDPGRRAQLRARLHGDVLRLVDEYGFVAARRWLDPPA